MRQEIKEILQHETKGSLVRSRFKENSESEFASLFHVNREKKNAAKNNLDSLKVGDEIIDNKDIIEENITKYFGALFNGHHNSDLVDTGHPFEPNNSDLPDFLAGLGKLSPEGQNKLAENLSFDEVEFIVKHDCDNNKSPGL